MHTQLPANRLTELRTAKGEKRYHLSALLDVDPSTVYRWEVGLSAIPDQAKLALADHFSVPIAHLMGWDDLDEESAA